MVGTPVTHYGVSRRGAALRRLLKANRERDMRDAVIVEHWREPDEGIWEFAREPSSTALAARAIIRVLPVLPQ